MSSAKAASYEELTFMKWGELRSVEVQTVQEVFVASIFMYEAGIWGLSVLQ